MTARLHSLEENALMFWPDHIAKIEKEASVIPKLIETQDKFISLLNIADSEPFAWKNVLETSKDLYPNLFLKHLQVLSDIGGEKLMRFKTALPNIFKDNILEFIWRNDTFIYEFKTLNNKANWTNKNLSIDGFGLLEPKLLTPLIEDVINLLLFGGCSTNQLIPVEIAEQCIIGNYIGRIEELNSIVKEKYILVSKITAGARANALGNIGQKYIKEFLKERLPENWNLNTKSIPGISQNEKTFTSFDIVVCSPKGITCAIEVSFQVTTNSTIERKAGQAKSRIDTLHLHGHKIAYVIDGAGNFARKSALQTICNHSDCTVTFNESDLEYLVQYLLNLDK